MRSESVSWYDNRPTHCTKSERESERERCFRSDFSSLSFCFSLYLYFMFEFQKLEVYKKAKLFHSDCKKLIITGKLDNYVKDQLGRASFSIPLNIAEGSGKFSKADRRNYFTTARASIFECVAALDILCDEGKLTRAEFEDLTKRPMSCQGCYTQ